MSPKLLKHLELAIRHTHLRITSREFTGTLIESPRRVVPMLRPKILLLRQDRIGDVICTTPILRNLREEIFPSSQIDMLLSRNNIATETLVSHWCNRVWCYEKSIPSFCTLISRLRREHYDLAIDLMDNSSSTSTIFLQLLKCPIRIGIMKENAWVYSHCVPMLNRAEHHYIERIAQLLLPLGIDPTMVNLDLTYPMSANDMASAAALLQLDLYPKRTGFLLIHISSRHEALRWRIENFITLIQLLRRRFPEISIGIAGAPEDHAMVQHLAREDKTFCIPICQTFHQYATLLHFARLVITPDTAIVHVAAAHKIPAVVLYHQGNPELMPWYPYHSPHRALVVQGRGTINSIPPTAVADATEDLLNNNTPLSSERIFVYS